MSESGSESVSPLPVTRKEVGKNVLYGSAGQVAGIGVRFFTTPIIVRGLGDAHYGFWGVACAVTVWFGLVSMVFSTSAVHFVGEALGAAKYRDAWSARGALVRWGLLAGLVAGVLLACFAGPLARGPLKVAPVFQSLAVKVLLIQAVFIMVDVLTSVYRGIVGGCQRLDLFYLLRTAALLIQAIGCAFWVSLGRGLLVIATWMVFVQCLECGCFLFASRRLQKRPETLGPASLVAWGKRLTHYGGRLMTGYASAQLMLPTSFILIGMFRPLQEVAYFAVLANLARNIRMISLQIANAVLPAASQKTGAGDREGLIDVFLSGLRWSWLTLVPLTVLGVHFAAPFIGAWIRQDFGVQIRPLALPLILGLSIWFLGTVPSAIAQGMGSAGQWAKASLFAGLLNAALGLFFIPKHGGLGASYGVLVSGSLLTLWLLFWVRRKLNIPWRRFAHALDLRVVVASVASLALVRWAHPAEMGSLFEVILWICAGGGLILLTSPLWLDKDERCWLASRLPLGPGR